MSFKKRICPSLESIGESLFFALFFSLLSSNCLAERRKRGEEEKRAFVGGCEEGRKDRERPVQSEEEAIFRYTHTHTIPRTNKGERKHDIFSWRHSDIVAVLLPFNRSAPGIKSLLS